MKPSCPNCKTNELMEYIGDMPSESCEMYDVEIYKCYKCNCEFDSDELEEEKNIPITEKWDRDAGDNAWCLPTDLGDK